MKKDSTLPDDFDHYEYYRYISGGDEPDVGIRVFIDKEGLQRLAETINPETGQFQNSTGRLSDISDGLYVEDSTEEEFNRLNAERTAWVKSQKLQKYGADGGPA